MKMSVFLGVDECVYNVIKCEKMRSSADTYWMWARCVGGEANSHSETSCNWQSSDEPNSLALSWILFILLLVGWLDAAFSISFAQLDSSRWTLRNIALYNWKSYRIWRRIPLASVFTIDFRDAEPVIYESHVILPRSARNILEFSVKVKVSCR